MNEVKARLHEVEIRFVHADACDSRESSQDVHAQLGAEERLHLARIRKAEERHDFLAAHSLARRMLARAAGCLPSQLRFRFAANGRLEVAAPAAAVAFRLSLGHADGIALCAITRGRAVGVHVASGRTLGPLGIASSLCSLREQQALRTLTAGRKMDSIVSLWTLREAIAQAAEHETRGSESLIDVGDAASWRVAVWRLTIDHFAAAAVSGDERDDSLRCEEDRPEAVPASRGAAASQRA